MVIDDEAYARESLAFLLKEHCPAIDVIALAGSAMEARELLASVSVQVLFLDVSMPNENGFQLLESLPPRKYQVVFVTASQEHALKAIKASAADYLLKPVDVEELKTAVATLLEVVQLKQQNELVQENYDRSMNGLARNMLQGEQFNFITLPFQQRFHAVAHNEILYLEADDNYTNIVLRDGKRILASRTLKDFEDSLEPNKRFFRIHKSYIVNLSYIRSFSKGEQANVELENHVSLPLSRRRQMQFNLLWKEIMAGR
jgi:two-component system LytT family response regulator